MPYNAWGLRIPDRRPPKPCPELAAMTWPVRCMHCQTVYDAGAVTVVARYVDCSVWISPCCRIQVDDRKPPWKHRADIVELNRDGTDRYPDPKPRRPARPNWLATS